MTDRDTITPGIHLDVIRANTADLIRSMTETVEQVTEHEHPAKGGDLYCLNLTSFMGDRMGAVLIRLAAEVAEVDRLRATPNCPHTDTRHHDVGECRAADRRTIQCLNDETTVLNSTIRDQAAEIDRLRAENAALADLRRAAEEWRAQFSKPDVIKFPRRSALIAAVDALPNMQEPCDICSSTAGGCPDCRDEQAEVARG